MDNSSLISYEKFDSFKSILAFTTTKACFGNKIVRFTGDEKYIYENSRKKLAQLIGVKTAQLVFPRQTHTNAVHEITEIPNIEISKTDALITNKKNICLCVQTADCVPVLLFDTAKMAVATIHSGWRGTVKKIPEKAIKMMIDKYKTNPADIIAAIGPSISSEVYEVGQEVVCSVLKSIPNAGITLQKNNSGKYHLDLWEANRQILLNCGVIDKNIQILAECSFKKRDKYFSARRDGVDTGRTVSGIMLCE